MPEQSRRPHTALNVLEHLSDIATRTRRFAEEVNGTRAKICGPREATPGMRRLEQYAIELIGGRGHHANDILLTTNHVRLAGAGKAALDHAHSLVALQLRPRSMTAYEAVGAASCQKRTLFRYRLKCRTNANCGRRWMPALSL